MDSNVYIFKFHLNFVEFTFIKVFSNVMIKKKFF